MGGFPGVRRKIIVSAWQVFTYFSVADGGSCDELTAAVARVSLSNIVYCAITIIRDIIAMLFNNAAEPGIV